MVVVVVVIMGVVVVVVAVEVVVVVTVVVVSLSVSDVDDRLTYLGIIVGTCFFCVVFLISTPYILTSVIIQ